MKLSERYAELDKMRLRLNHDANTAAEQKNWDYYEYALRVLDAVVEVSIEVGSRQLRDGNFEMTNDEVIAQNVYIAQAAHLDPGDLSRLPWDDLDLRVRWSHLLTDQDHGQQVRNAIMREMFKREFRKQMARQS